ncbi:hypothetical protein D3C86_1725280 [compost metagenome]
MWQFSFSCHIRTEITFRNCSNLRRAACFDRIWKTFNRLRNYWFIPVEYAGRVGTSSHTKTAANTPFCINTYYTILTFKGGVYRANFYAWRVITMQTYCRLPKWGCILSVLHWIYFDPVLMITHKMSMVTSFLAFFKITAAG